MATVDVVSPRTVRAKRILKDLSREELRELARPGEKTSEYGSPVYSTRVKNRSAKNTYVVADRVPIGVMQQPIDRDRAEDAIGRPGDPRGHGTRPVGRADGDEPRGSDPLPAPRSEGVRAHRLHVAQHALPVGLGEGARLHLGVRAGLEGAPDLSRRRPGLHLHPRHRLPRRGEEVDAPSGDVLDQAARRPGAARGLEGPARDRQNGELEDVGSALGSGPARPL